MYVDFHSYPQNMEKEKTKKRIIVVYYKLRDPYQLSDNFTERERIVLIQVKKKEVHHQLFQYQET